MELPEGLLPLLDGDVLRYELGYGAETGWRAITEDAEAVPPFSYVEGLLLERIETIKRNCHTDKDPVIYITEGRTFRYDIAKRKPYKDQRKETKPYHFNNLSVYLKHVLNCIVVTGIEADDQLVIDHVSSGGTTILCSRDKDLKQAPGWFHSWELGRQPSFGPELITNEGYITISDNHKTIKGCGLAFFYSQVLTGDTVDNIPGLPNCGPVRAFELLNGKTPEEMLSAVVEAYQDSYPDTWEAELTEQGQLCWLLRKPDALWQIGIVE